MSKIVELIKDYCPTGVQKKSLAEIGVILGGMSGKSKDDFTGGNSKYITYMNIYKNPKTDLNVTDYVNIKENENQHQLKKGDVLFTGSSETPDECGISSVVCDEVQEPIYLNSFCFIFRTEEGIFNPHFLKHLFRSYEIRNQIGKTANGVTRYNVSKKLFAKVEIPIPPMEVQNEIVRILDNFTELTAELTAELEARTKQYDYYANRLLVNNKYRRITLGEIGDIKMCRRIFKEETTTQGEIPFYKIGTFGGSADAYISNSLYNEYRIKYSFPKKGDILISASGTIGRTVEYNGEKAYFQDSNIVWIDNDEELVLNKYLYYLYSVIEWKVSTGGTISRLYNNIILNTEVGIPPLNEQERIVSILDKFSTLVTNIKEGLPAEIELRRKQYEYYRNKLLTFDRE